MRQLKTVVSALFLSSAALAALLFVTKASVRAEPDVPTGTLILDTCTEAGFNNALASANDGDVIHVRCALSFPVVPGAITFSAQKTITKSITILGTHPATGVNRLSGGGATSLFQVNNGATLTLTHITLENGDHTSSGGCVEVYGALTALTTTLRYCRTSNTGGAIYANTSQVVLTNTTFYSNTADSSGGGLYVYNSTVSASRSRFDSNRAGNYGGGYFQRLGSVRFDATTLTSNTARYRGGGLYVTEVPTLFVHNSSRVEFNRATDLTNSFGGGAYFTASVPFIDQAYFTGNTAEKSGGGLYSENSGLALYHSVISDNVAQDESGGGVDFRGVNSYGSIYSNLFYGNYSYPYGGGLFNEGNLNTGYNQFFKNQSYYGGGIYHEDTGVLQIYHTTFDQNTGAYGAGLRTEGRIDYGMNLTFTLNTATYDGGAFYSNSAGSNRTTLTDVIFLDNKVYQRLWRRFVYAQQCHRHALQCDHRRQSGEARRRWRVGARCDNYDQHRRDHRQQSRRHRRLQQRRRSLHDRHIQTHAKQRAGRSQLDRLSGQRRRAAPVRHHRYAQQCHAQQQPGHQCRPRRRPVPRKWISHHQRVDGQRQHGPVQRRRDRNG